MNTAPSVDRGTKLHFVNVVNWSLNDKCRIIENSVTCLYLFFTNKCNILGQLIYHIKTIMNGT